MTTHRGSCHCGQVAFEVDVGDDPGPALACNCSICQRKGSLLWFVPRAALRLLTPDDAAATYTFHAGRIRHRFCPRCGLHPYAEGAAPDGSAMAAVNVRCLDGIDPKQVPVEDFDGRAR